MVRNVRMTSLSMSIFNLPQVNLIFCFYFQVSLNFNLDLENIRSLFFYFIFYLFCDSMLSSIEGVKQVNISFTFVRDIYAHQTNTAIFGHPGIRSICTPFLTSLHQLSLSRQIILFTHVLLLFVAFCSVLFYKNNCPT